MKNKFNINDIVLYCYKNVARVVGISKTENDIEYKIEFLTKLEIRGEIDRVVDEDLILLKVEWGNAKNIQDKIDATIENCTRKINDFEKEQRNESKEEIQRLLIKYR